MVVKLLFIMDTPILYTIIFTIPAVLRIDKFISSSRFELHKASLHNPSITYIEIGFLRSIPGQLKNLTCRSDGKLRRKLFKSYQLWFQTFKSV